MPDWVLSPPAGSAGTEAAAEYITTKLTSANPTIVCAEWERNTGRRDLPALLGVGVENGTPSSVPLVTIHELRGVER